ncbi:MAG: IS1595 family transposase, partial [Candidatus Scalindua sp.]|nr:IS1595 family transposase [Candidatus Scalindua sp.]
MEKLRINETLENLISCSAYQFRIIQEKIEEIKLRKCVSVELETPVEDIVCPHCKSTHFQRWGRRSDLQRYRCRSCKRTFNSLTGTPLARLKRKGHWLDYSECIRDSLTIRAAAIKCGISIDTSFRWRHRFLTNAKKIKASSLRGVVEADEIKFSYSYKGQRSIDRPPRKRGGNDNESDKCVSFLISRDRNKFTFDKVIENISTPELHCALDGLLESDVLLCCDNKDIYKEFAIDNSLRHGVVDISNGEFIKKDVVHIQNTRVYCNKMRNWMERFHGVATKYLESYVSWYR